MKNDVKSKVAAEKWLINLAECSIRVTVPLEYLDLAYATRSWLWNHNSVVCNPILLYYCKDFL